MDASYSNRARTFHSRFASKRWQNKNPGTIHQSRGFGEAKALVSWIRIRFSLREGKERKAKVNVLGVLHAKPIGIMCRCLDRHRCLMKMDGECLGACWDDDRQLASVWSCARGRTCNQLGRESSPGCKSGHILTSGVRRDLGRLEPIVLGKCRWV